MSFTAGATRSLMLARDRIVFPLDVPRLADAQVWLTRLSGHVGVFKVGLELFVAEGQRAVDAVHANGSACFLDLKLHDIPATMVGAVQSAIAMNVRFLTVHASAGPKALAEVARAAEGSRTQILAVTVLTSMDEAETLALGWGSPAEQVSRLANVAVHAGVSGLVCSPIEVRALRAQYPKLTLMVPGVRPIGSASGDQARVATPEQAVADGADYLVIGRPIRHASDPKAAADAIAASVAASEAPAR